jgi:hypothetical protein
MKTLEADTYTRTLWTSSKPVIGQHRKFKTSNILAAWKDFKGLTLCQHHNNLHWKHDYLLRQMGNIHINPVFINMPTNICNW